MLWEDLKKWSDKFLPEIKRILGEHLITESLEVDDATRNTDLIVLKLEPMRIACRIRKYKYLKRYGNEITIRSSVPSGNKTELEKIKEGFGDWFFYGFADPTETCLCQWLIGDLNVLREHIDKCQMQTKNNFDGSSSFVAIKHKDIPNFVIASQEYLIWQFQKWLKTHETTGNH